MASTIILDALSAVLSLDWYWWVSVIMANLHYLFALWAITYFFYEGKNVFPAFIFLVIYVWASVTFWQSIGLVFFVASFLMANYIMRVTVTIFASDMQSLKHRLPLVIVMQFLFMLVLLYFGLVPGG